MARFPYLYQALRAGIQIMPDAAPPGRFFGVSPDSGRLGCDALATVWFAEFYDRERSEGQDGMLKNFLSVDLADSYPVLRSDLGPSCPAESTGACPHKTAVPPALEQKIIHLQDCHGLTRDELADWLETQGL